MYTRDCYKKTLWIVNLFKLIKSLYIYTNYTKLALIEVFFLAELLASTP